MADGQNINIESEVEDFKERARPWFGVEVSEESAPKLRDLIALAGDIEKRIETRRKLLKQPHLEAGKAIDATHAELSGPITKGRDALKKALAKFLMAEEARRQEAARIAAREAEAARKVAGAEADPFADFDASQAAQKQEAADRVAKAPVNVSGIESGRAAGLRTYWIVDVVDGPALVTHFAQSPVLAEEARKLASAIVRDNKGADCGIPGIKITEDKRVV